MQGNQGTAWRLGCMVFPGELEQKEVIRNKSDSMLVLELVAAAQRRWRWVPRPPCFESYDVNSYLCTASWLAKDIKAR